MTWVFGDFEVDEDLFELRRAGARVALRPKPLRLLLHLARNSSRVVPAEDLRKALWPGVIVAEVSLRQIVRALRRALDDESGQLVVSIRSVGYRLRIPVHHRAAPVPGAALELLAAGSVIGSTFQLATLRQVLGWSDEQLVECGRQAVSARVISEISPGTFSFCHELMRDCLVQLSPLVRSRLDTEVARSRALGRSDQRWRPRLDLVRRPRSA